MIELVGYTGFVGSNIYAQGGIDRGFNSQNIAEAYGTQPDLLIYAGMRAEKYLANTNPAADLELVKQAQENIRRIDPKKLVLISTVDVLKAPNGKDEDAFIETDGLQTYGLNRYYLEQWVRENYPDALIIRLPGLYGQNIKKNFIYDYINVIPFMLREAKFCELAQQAPMLRDCYELQSNGFYKCKALEADGKEALKDVFRKLNFTALNFTDSRNVYQFYPLQRLWDDIRIALDQNLKLWHPATEPVSAGEVYEYLTGQTFTNHITDQPVAYDFRTKHGKCFGDTEGYIMNKAQVLEDIRRFTEQMLHG